MSADNPKNEFQKISAITLATADMAAAVGFYEALGMHVVYGGPRASFTSFSLGTSYLNLVASSERTWSWWGRVIIYVEDVDRLHARALAAGLRSSTRPRDASWGERYFHISDPDGHELSFARPLASGTD